MYGHEHDEWMQIYSSVSDPKKFVGLSFMSGSATSFVKKNPGFTVVEIDEELMIPLNFKIYIFNISKADQNPGKTPTWELLHDYLDHYQLSDLSPDTIYQNLALKVRDNEDTAKKYLWNKIK